MSVNAHVYNFHCSFTHLQLKEQCIPSSISIKQLLKSSRCCYPKIIICRPLLHWCATVTFTLTISSNLQGDTRTSISTDTNGRRLRLSYECARYNPKQASWERDCKTVYNTARPADGVFCLCSHNTSFAVLMVGRFSE